MFLFYMYFWDGAQASLPTVETEIPETNLITGRYWSLSRITPSQPLYVIDEEFR